MKEIIQGYKLNNYDANYEEVTFLFEEVFKGKQRNIRIVDINSGLEFYLAVETPSERKKKQFGLPQ